MTDTVRFTVTGRLPFPADMLRYDRCWPVDGAINAMSDPRYVEDKRVTVTLEGHACTPARWHSFLWSVDRESFQGNVNLVSYHGV